MLTRAQITLRSEAGMHIGIDPPLGELRYDQLWLDTYEVPNVLYRWDGQGWVKCGDDVDLEDYYTRDEMNTMFEQTNAKIALKADSTALTALTARVSNAELKITPTAMVSTVRTSAQYQNDLNHGRNYVLQSHNIHSFVDTKYRYASGANTTLTGWMLNLSPDLYAHSGSGSNLRISFDLKRTNVDTTNASYNYTGVWVYYRAYAADGVTVSTANRGYYLRTTDANFVSTDSDWVRITLGPLNLSSYAPIELTQFQLGTSGATGTTGTVQFRNVQVEASNAFTSWSAAPEDLGALPGRMTSAESSITQNAGNIALKVSQSIYDQEKIIRSATAPTNPTYNMLWLNTSVSSYLLNRWNGSAWVAVGADKVVASGINIAPNSITLRTSNFLLQLLDPNNNENVLMEMRANGNVGFRDLYAENIVSGSIVPAYNRARDLIISTEYIGNYYNVFQNMRAAVEFINGKYLTEDVIISFWNSVTETVYDSEGIEINGLSGPGSQIIRGNAAKTVAGYMHINNCSAPVIIEYLNMRDSRQRLGGNGLHPALIYARHCKLLDVSDSKLNCNGVSADAVQADYTTAHFWSSQVSNAYAAFGITAGTGLIESVSGNPTISMECTAGHIFCVGQVPNGTRKRNANGVIYDTGISTGTGTTQPSVTPESKMTFQASLTRSYQGAWRSDTYDLVQGLYSSSGYLSSLSWNYGCMWFGTLRSSLSGRTVRSATLTLKRKDGGSAGITNLWLHGISNTTNSGACVSNINHGQVCSIARGSTIMFAIPTSAVQRLISGADGGLCLYESPYNFGGSAYSQNYCRMVGTDGDVRPVLNVVYV